MKNVFIIYIIIINYELYHFHITAVLNITAISLQFQKLLMG